MQSLHFKMLKEQTVLLQETEIVYKNHVTDNHNQCILNAMYSRRAYISTVKVMSEAKKVLLTSVAPA